MVFVEIWKFENGKATEFKTVMPKTFSVKDDIYLFNIV